MKSFTPSFGETAKFGGNRDWCSEIEDFSIPYSNFTSLFVSLSAHVPTKNAKSLTPFGGTEKVSPERAIGAEDLSILQL